MMRPPHVLLIACLTAALSSCHTKSDTLFSRLKSGETGITFSNDIEPYEDNLLNPLDYDYLYNGGGVAIADFNNDGKQDIYFSGNKVSSRMYLNDGDGKGKPLHFRDVTTESGTGTKQWATGVSAVDINQDGWMDLYVCMAGPSDNPADKVNRLFINTGGRPSEKAADNRSAGAVPKFREMAHEYGLDDTGYSTQAAFLDYDRDGDLDCYLLTNLVVKSNRNVVRPKYVNGESPSTDRLYRNDGKRHFTNVSREEGINIEGYGLGVAVSDLNADGWPDIYVANDFLSNDLVWINQHDGAGRHTGFRNRAGDFLKHTSWNGMGMDVADINNDARPDVLVVDMLPESSPRQKQMMMKLNVDLFQLLKTMNYETQQVRNTLQLNNGNVPGSGNVPGVSFSEIGQLAGIEKTDWSWSPLFADFDNDGHRDLLITNGYRREVNNLDYIAKLNEASPFGDLGSQGLEQRAKAQNLADLKKLPNLKMRSYLYQNRGDLTFADRSADWGINEATYSNGAAYADLDNDGDLDLVINNMDEEAGVYQNNLYTPDKATKPTAHFLRFRLLGDATGRYARDATVTLTLPDGSLRWQENSPVRGFVSSVEPIVHLGLGNYTTVPTTTIKWSNGQVQTLRNLRSDQMLTVAYRPDTPQPSPVAAPQPYFFTLNATDIGLPAAHIDNEVIDFKRTPILPNRHSKNGPGLAVGDVNGDGLDDLFMGADAGQVRQVRVQLPGGQFRSVPIPETSPADDMGALLLDVDNDRDLDLYVVSGGSHEDGESALYQDRLYANDGRGNFRLTAGLLPPTRSSGSCVVAADYDHDGDLDLFRAGRVVPGTYPMPAASYLLVNDGKGHFSDKTAQLAPDLQKPGLVCSALWTDYDHNGTPDLLLMGEWMTPTFYKNNGQKLTKTTVVPNAEGWWNSAVSGDFDHDGDQDYVLGNAGLNHPYRASVDEPVAVYAADFDKNGRIDPVVTRYFGHTNYVSALRDMFLDQMPGIRNRYKTYGDFAAVPFTDFFSKDEMQAATVLKAVCMSSSYLENRGNGPDGNPQFVAHALPMPAQISAIFGMQVLDANNDGNLDILAVGNSYAPDPQTGNLDASVGTLLRGNGKGGFTNVAAPQTGLRADHDAKSMVLLRIAGKATYLVANNNGPLQAIRPTRNQAGTWFALQPTQTGATVTLPNGKRYQQEMGYGSGYLSQSARAVWLPTGAKAVAY